MKLNKFLSAALTVAMVGTTFSATAFAEDSQIQQLDNGTYRATLQCLHETKEQLSMCDPMFVHTADVTLTDDSMDVSVYLANPVPAFPEQGADGTVKNVKITIGETQYEFTSDMETKAEKKFDVSNSLFGIEAGESYTTQGLSVNLPRTALEELQVGAKVDAYVNVVMNSDQVFRFRLSGFVPTESVKDPEPEKDPVPETDPAVKETKSAQITADVAEQISEPSYSVVVPEKIALGTLSAEKDNTASYDVKVIAKDLNGSSVTVGAVEAGKLLSGKNEIAFTNTFKSQTVSQDTAEAGVTFNGNINVSKTAVEKAAAGNYTGTTTFTINFVPAK